MVLRCYLAGSVLIVLLFVGCTSSSDSEASEFREDFDVTLTLTFSPVTTSSFWT